MFQNSILPLFKIILGRIHLKCHLSHKISKINGKSGGHGVPKFKLGHMVEQKGFGSEIFFGSNPEALKVGPMENFII